MPAITSRTTNHFTNRLVDNAIVAFDPIDFSLPDWAKVKWSLAQVPRRFLQRQKTPVAKADRMIFS